MFSKDIEWKSFRWELFNGIRFASLYFIVHLGAKTSIGDYQFIPFLCVYFRGHKYSHSATKRQQIIQPPPPPMLLLLLMMMAAKVMIAQLFETTIHPNILYSWGFTVAMVEVVVVATRQWKITRPDHVSPCDGYKLDLADWLAGWKDLPGWWQWRQRANLYKLICSGTFPSSTERRSRNLWRYVATEMH